MRLAPYLSQVYRPGSASYSSVRGGLLPVFRLYALVRGGEELVLWGSTVLYMPGSDSVMSYPSGLEMRRFRREDSRGTLIDQATWGQVRNRLR